MSAVLQEDVLKRLKKIRDPNLSLDIVSLGLVSKIFVADKKVFFSITIPFARVKEYESLRITAEKAIEELPGVKRAIVTLTEEKHYDDEKSSLAISAKSNNAVSRLRTLPEGVKHIIAVASGKGGVGKSTTVVNLALALSEQGLAIGLLDADIYGPSIPWLVGFDDRPEMQDRKLVPLERYGLKLMSIGFLVEKDTAIIWRGPMVRSAINQMLKGVLWGKLDVLLVDMPPGTGDTQLTLLQQVPLSGVVIVSTPQDLALINACRCIGMFTKVGTPILGILENMSYFVAPDTGRRYEIFGHGGARREAKRREIPFLGEIALDPQLCILSDQGKPIVLAQPKNAHTRNYSVIARKIMKQLAIKS